MDSNHGPRSTRSAGGHHQGAFSSQLNKLASAAHALACQQDPELTRAVTRDLVNDSRDGKAADLLRQEIGEALLNSSTDDQLLDLPDLDPTLAAVKDASPDTVKQVARTIGWFPAEDKVLADGSNWLPMLSALITLANSKRLSYDQVRDTLFNQVQGTPVFKLAVRTTIDRPNLPAALQSFGVMRCRGVTMLQLKKHIKDWTLNPRDIGGSIHSLTMLFNTRYPGLPDEEIDDRVATYLVEMDKLPTPAGNFIDTYQTAFHSGTNPSLKTLINLLETFYYRNHGTRSPLITQPGTVDQASRG